LKLKLGYGTETLTVRVPDSARVQIATPLTLPDSRVDLRAAAEDPVAGAPLPEIVGGAERVLVVVNDATRPTPTPAMLDAVMPFLSDVDVRIAVAAGAHKAPTDDELQSILGRRHVPLEGLTLIHDARGVPGEPLAVTSMGTPVSVNPAVAEADATVALTSVEPHFMAGFTGGRKSLVPGLAAYRTIEMNHRLAIRDGAEPLRLEGNPLNEDLEEAVDLLETDVFCVNAVLDARGHPVHASGGRPRESLRAAAAVAEEVYAPRVDEPADVAVAAANHPLDRDLYQAQKAIENVKGAVRDGGIIILVSRCWDGIGPPHYVETLESLAGGGLDPDHVFQNYRLGHHKPVRMARLLQRVRVWGVTQVPQAALRKAMVEPFSDLQDALDEALRIVGRDACVLWVPMASTTVPVPA
jgi:nickel-dependent lactate racemase